jgi:hypothetical protein
VVVALPAQQLESGALAKGIEGIRTSCGRRP